MPSGGSRNMFFLECVVKNSNLVSQGNVNNEYIGMVEERGCIAMILGLLSNNIAGFIPVSSFLAWKRVKTGVYCMLYMCYLMSAKEVVCQSNTAAHPPLLSRWNKIWLIQYPWPTRIWPSLSSFSLCMSGKSQPLGMFYNLHHNLKQTAMTGDCSNDVWGWLPHTMCGQDCSKDVNSK